MGICSSKPDHPVIKKSVIVSKESNQDPEIPTESTVNVVPVDSSYVIINLSDIPLHENKTTRYIGLDGLCNDTEELFTEKRVHTYGDTPKTSVEIKKSRIPVATWGSKKTNNQCVCKNRKVTVIEKQSGVPSKSHKINVTEKPNVASGDKILKARNEKLSLKKFEGKRPTVDSTSYTITVGQNRTLCKTNVMHVKQCPPKKQAVFNQPDRLLMAEINRQKQLKARVQKARQYQIKKQDIEERRLAMSAELRDKLLKKQEKRELAIMKEHIETRLDNLKKNIARARFYQTDDKK